MYVSMQDLKWFSMQKKISKTQSIVSKTVITVLNYFF